jgi:hypothetical protein
VVRSGIVEHFMAPVGRSVLQAMIQRVDDRLSQFGRVRPFDLDPACILRVAPIRAPRPIKLSDGAAIRSGDLVLDVHCWNERVPAMPSSGADLVWARKAAKGLKTSLVLLARAIETDPSLRPARAIRARVNFVALGGSNVSLSHIIGRMGFEDVDEGSRTLAARLEDALDNVLIAALVWTHNPAALRREKLVRERRPVWCSREQFMLFHGGSPGPRQSALPDPRCAPEAQCR